ncbi:MAG: hypothetical protein R3F62_26475 [Planctomycetota bacterium]
MRRRRRRAGGRGQRRRPRERDPAPALARAAIVGSALKTPDFAQVLPERVRALVAALEPPA